MFQATCHKRVLGGVLVALLVAGIAITIRAQVSSNTINACVNAAGLVRVVPPRTACLGSEQPIEWNITGPQGPAGPQGPPGEAGVAKTLHVYCGTDTVGAALAQGADQSGRLTIVVHGVCTETVTIDRDDVTLRAASDGDGLTAPPASTTSTVNVAGAQRVSLEDLTIQGGRSGLQLSAGAAVSGFYLRITGAGESGVSVGPGSTVDLGHCTIEHSARTNVDVGQAGSASLVNSTVRNAGAAGIGAFGGLVKLDDVTVEGNAQGLSVVLGRAFITSSRIRNNGKGIWMHGGGARIEGTGIYDNGSAGLSLSAATAELLGVWIINNAQSGVQAHIGSRIIIGGGTIRGNGGHGIWLKDTSVLGGFDPVGTKITENKWYGVFCSPAPAVAQIAAPISSDSGFILNGTNVFGNIQGQINCPGIVLP